MRKNFQKNIIALFCFWFFIIVFSLVLPMEIFSQGRPLEVEYPEISGLKPETVEFGIADYAKYIFNFIIVICGIIAFGSLVWAGVRYLISTGKPEELKKAKKQIKYAFLGILILLFSYLILTTINPRLVLFQVPQLLKPSPPEPTLPEVKPPRAPTPLGRINEIAQNLKTATEGIKYYAQRIRDLTQQCDCQNTWSMCLCKTYQGGSCELLYCRLGPDSHPCPNWEEIKEAQKKIIAFGDEAVYYKNRIEAEKGDLVLEIEQLQQKIAYYEKRIEIEKDVLAKILAEEEIARKNQEILIASLEEIKNNLELELGVKETASENLDTLSDLISKLSGLVVKLAEPPNSLIDSCWQRVKEVCQGHCQGGCHDTAGCFPEKCSGGNPCLIDEINQTVADIKEIAGQIISVCEDIFSAHDIVHPPVVPPPVPPSCEVAGGMCVSKDRECPSGYYSSDKFSCKESEKVCCLPEKGITCQCSKSPFEGCVNLGNYGIACKHGCYADRGLAEKLAAFKNCLSQNGISGWRITEACPPTIQHRSRCHHISGKCVDADSQVLCRDSSTVKKCINEAGFRSYLDECNTSGPHFHINF